MRADDAEGRAAGLKAEVERHVAEKERHVAAEPTPHAEPAARTLGAVPEEGVGAADRALTVLALDDSHCEPSEVARSADLGAHPEQASRSEGDAPVVKLFQPRVGALRPRASADGDNAENAAVQSVEPRHVAGVQSSEPRHGMTLRPKTSRGAPPPARAPRRSLLRSADPERPAGHRPSTAPAEYTLNYAARRKLASQSQHNLAVRWR